MFNSNWDRFFLIDSKPRREKVAATRRLGRGDGEEKRKEKDAPSGSRSHGEKLRSPAERGGGEARKAVDQQPSTSAKLIKTFVQEEVIRIVGAAPLPSPDVELVARIMSLMDAVYSNTVIFGVFDFPGRGSLHQRAVHFFEIIGLAGWTAEKIRRASPIGKEFCLDFVSIGWRDQALHCFSDFRLCSGVLLPL
ncbi:hypothetical protein Aduo_018431 [Ancylostoma duodenale]